MTAQQHHLTAAATLARSIAGDDDTRFAVVFHALANHVETLAAGDRNSNFEQTRAQLLAARDSSRRATASTTGATDNALLYSDRVYLENLDALGSAKTAIVGGELTTDFPDCVAVGSQTKWCCSGTLVSPNVVVTAAHCIGACSERVYFGTDVRFPEDGRIVAVKSAVKHPAYRTVNDIAVLILAEPVQDVEPRAMITHPPTTTAVRLAGFGNTDNQGRKGYGRRRRVDVPLASSDPRYGADPALEFVAGAPMLDRDSCSGDSGGPAYVAAGDTWLLAGATSRATNNSLRPCGDGGIYSRVDVHAEWIRSVKGGLW